MLRRQVDGVLLLDKPAALTSNAALQAARRLYGAAKAGHGGTLDPLATGLLPILFGEATKFGAVLLNADKTYEARLALGVTTTTGDAAGAVIGRRAVHVTREEVAAVLRRFCGTIEQVPPMYSALKHRGRPLYAYARAGETVPRVARSVTIRTLVLRAFEEDYVDIMVQCSKGTYVRVLAEDIGQALGCGAHLTGLRRVAIGRYGFGAAHTLAELERGTPVERATWLRPIDELLGDLPAVHLDPDRGERFAQGQAVEVDAADASTVRVYCDSAVFLGIGERSAAGLLRPRRLRRTDRVRGATL